MKFLKFNSDGSPAFMVPFEDAVEPLMKWLADNEPNMSVVVTSTKAELLESQMTIGVDESIKD